MLKNKGKIKPKNTKEDKEVSSWDEDWSDNEETWSDWKEWNKQLKAKEKAEKEKIVKEKVKKKKRKKIKLRGKDIEKVKKIKKQMKLKIKRKGFKRLDYEKEKYELDWERNKDLVGLGLDALLETGPERIVLRKVLEKLPKRKSYVRDQCQHRDEEGIRCTFPAVGSGQLCEKHGGRLFTGEGHDTVTSIIQTLLNKNSKYHPIIHPLDYIKFSQKGLSDAEIAAEFKISVWTLKNWVEKYNDFGEAYEIGQAMQEAWWLEKGKSGLEDTRNFNTPLYKFLTGNKLGYSDKIETKSHNTHTHGVLVVPGQVSIDDWEKKRKVNQILNDSDEDVVDAEYSESDSND